MNFIRKFIRSDISTAESWLNIIRETTREFSESSHMLDQGGFGSEFLQYNFNTIREATDNFSERLKLGQGGFGTVYKGKLKNGQEIAVKRLRSDAGQGGEIEFKNEVLLIANLQHRNLVRLLGFSLKGSERLLIYEFLPNASVDRFIFDETKRSELDWDRRYKIIAGVARGLVYLHEDSRLRIIHRDIKAGNVLLDAEMNPKITDFGIATLLNQVETETDRIVGTYGYMAPEYAIHGQLSVKSDVFSFGVFVLEIVTGRRNQSFRNEEGAEHLLSYAWKSWRDGTASEMIDPTLKATSGSLRDIIRSIHIGLLCIQENVVDRPTMAAVGHMLNCFSVTLPMPSEPGFFNQRSSFDPENTLTHHEDYYHTSGTSNSSQWTSNSINIRKKSWRKEPHLKKTFAEIESATHNFRTFLGKGGFGEVYKGELSISGVLTPVAVKRLNSRLSGQGRKEFLTEIQLLSECNHPNLISLLAYCEEGDEKVLVYEYAEHGSLDRYLSSANTLYDLTWLQRIKICLGAARCLHYLHSRVGEHHRVIHRDIKSANILLDQNWEAKIADLGLSKIGLANQNKSYLISNACGTHGYCDPAYINTGILTKESDVYSFGVVLFEVLCGRLNFINRNDEQRFLSSLAPRYYETNKLDEIVDPKIREQMDSDSLHTFSAIAYKCLLSERAQRPSMSVVVKGLEEALEFQVNSV